MEEVLYKISNHEVLYETINGYAVMKGEYTQSDENVVCLTMESKWNNINKSLKTNMKISGGKKMKLNLTLAMTCVGLLFFVSVIGVHASNDYEKSLVNSTKIDVLQSALDKTAMPIAPLGGFRSDDAIKEFQKSICFEVLISALEDLAFYIGIDNITEHGFELIGVLEHPLFDQVNVSISVCEQSGFIFINVTHFMCLIGIAPELFGEGDFNDYLIIQPFRSYNRVASSISYVIDLWNGTRAVRMNKMARFLRRDDNVVVVDRDSLSLSTHTLDHRLIRSVDFNRHDVYNNTTMSPRAVTYLNVTHIPPNGNLLVIEWSASIFHWPS